MINCEEETKKIALEEQGLAGRSDDWRLRYAELVTRRTFRISSAIKVNPHDPSMVSRGDMIAEE